jgi:hypothetical protein
VYAKTSLHRLLKTNWGIKMNALLKHQLRTSYRQWLVITVFIAIITFLPIININVFTIPLVCILLLLNRVYYFDFLLKNDHYRHLLPTNQTKTIFQTSFLSGLLSVIYLYIVVLLSNIYLSKNLRATSMLGSDNVLLEAIQVTIGIFLIALVIIGYFIHYAFRDGLREQFGVGLLIFLGVSIIYATPVLFFLTQFSAEWFWLRVLIVGIISFSIYYLMYKKTVKLIPVLVIRPS